MNRKMVFYLVGQMIRLTAVLMILPTCVAFLYGESCFVSFCISIGIALGIGTVLTLVFKPDNKVIYAKEGYITVAFSWLALSAVGALPFYISGEIPSYVDAFFETVSGFTTTGASILTNVEAMSKGLLFWRSFTHWIGGMGVLVFIMAIIPSLSDRSIHLMRAEVPGPVVGKLVPRIKDTARILYTMYLALTALEIVFLLAGGMPLFDSLVHTFGTAGTGGFGIKADSIAGYSHYLQWVITIFMLLFGINFNVYYLLLLRNFKQVRCSGELWTYLGIVGVSTALVAANIMPLAKNAMDALRLSAFQVASIITTTGYATTDFNLWPTFSKSVLLVLMFIGACAGSTAGGIKVSRVVMLFKMIWRELRHMLHPRSVGVVKFEGKRVDDNTLSSVGTYFALYMVLFFAIFLLMSLEPFDIETTFSATASCFNNVGPALGAAGPASSYAEFSDFSKVLLSLAMLFGRLEIYPLLFALTPSTWMKNK